MCSIYYTLGVIANIQLYKNTAESNAIGVTIDGAADSEAEGVHGALALIDCMQVLQVVWKDKMAVPNKECGKI